jgi:hypothetical protein
MFIKEWKGIMDNELIFGQWLVILLGVREIRRSRLSLLGRGSIAIRWLTKVMQPGNTCQQTIIHKFLLHCNFLFAHFVELCFT